MPSAARRTGLDIGRIVMVPIAALTLLADIRALTKGVVVGGATVTTLLGWLATVLACAFYSLVIWGYLRRGPAIATAKSLAASVVAIIATFTPFALPLLSGAAPGAIRRLASDVLLVSGAALSVWALRCLGRNLSVIAQARGVAERGPYRFVRHPLYTGELISGFGLALLAGTWAAFALWCASVMMQVYRARQEEQVLLLALPGYRDYRTRTAALVPGLL